MIEMFWEEGAIHGTDNIILRRIDSSDKEHFLELEKDYSVLPAFFKDDRFREMLWEEHNRSSALTFVIQMDDCYAGYCGISDINNPVWEIMIMLKRNMTRKGLGTIAIKTMLDAIVSRTERREFIVRIDVDNIASRSLFEKLGAVPDGIDNVIIKNEQEKYRFEEENLSRIDEDMVETAKRFGVEPRKLLSHALKYKLYWEPGLM